MIKRSTWVLLAILVLAVGAYFIIKSHPVKSSQATPTTTSTTFLITNADGVLQSLRIVDSKGNSVRMQRDPSKVWVLTEPTTGQADQGLAGAAESQVGALRIVTLLATPSDLNTFSLASPAYTIELTFDSGVQHKIEVGALTLTGSGYYVRFDTQKIFVVSQDGIDALTNLLNAPPYPPTATPVPTEPATLTPTQEASISPTATTSETVTPTP